MVQRVLILMVAMHVFVLMDGREMIAARTSMIVLMLLASMVQHALTELEILRVDARPERLDYYVIWMTLVHQIHAIRMQFVRQVRLMDHLHAHVLKDLPVRIVLRTLMNAILDLLASIMGFV